MKTRRVINLINDKQTMAQIKVPPCLALIHEYQHVLHIYMSTMFGCLEFIIIYYFYYVNI